MPITLQGDIPLKLTYNNTITCKDVLCHPDIQENLFSISKAADAGYYTIIRIINSAHRLQ